MELIQYHWYTWGAPVALGIALLAAFWIFYDAHRKQEDTAIWKMIAVFAIVLILPSAFISFLPDLRVALGSALQALELLGIGAALITLLAVTLYLLGIGTYTGMRCANCHRPRDPHWPYCPYCEYDKPAAVPAPLQPIGYQPMADYVPPPPVETAPMEPELHSSPTMSLSASTQLLPSMPQDGGTRIKPQPTDRAYLVIRSGTHNGKTFQLGDDTKIGRKAESNDIVLDDDAVSREHARVLFEKGKFVLIDLASSNGTRIQDLAGEWKKIQQRTLKDGMMIKMGETLLSYMQVKSEPLAANSAPAEEE